jgi:cell fate regulator YaaT (PSP1 superfamily)
MPQVAIVRYGAMERTGRFTLNADDIHIGHSVIIRTPRGVEWGSVMQTAPADDDEKTTGEVLRRTTQGDVEKHENISERQEVEEFQTCKKLIHKHDLPMKLVDVEHLFGGHKIIFYFLADGRVDFRGLVRDLAKEYRTRIEMRQIGVRDEARLMGLMGPCGQEICCRRFLQTLKPVPMKLAKDQKSTLDPAKISGACGRLKCCLKYEEGLYKEFKKELPRRGARVNSPEGKGQVVDYDILTRTVTVQLGENRRQTFSSDELEVLPKKKKNQK